MTEKKKHFILIGPGHHLDDEDIKWFDLLKEKLEEWYSDFEVHLHTIVNSTGTEDLQQLIEKLWNQNSQTIFVIIDGTLTINLMPTWQKIIENSSIADVIDGLMVTTCEATAERVQQIFLFSPQLSSCMIETENAGKLQVQIQTVLAFYNYR